MNGAHLHLLLNHVPVIGSVFGLALLGYALLRRDSALAKVSLGAFVLLALVAGGVYLTGEPAEELVENIPGIAESAIETHEEAALVATLALGVFGLGALLTLIVSRARRLSRAAMAVALLAGLGVTMLMGWTANLGGKIRHSEIGSAAGTAAAEHRRGDER